MNEKNKMPSIEESSKLINQLRENISLSIFGQEKLITEAMCCLLSGGHILMTGAPGLAKTTLVRVFARFLGLDYSRIQFTPDLLPNDITGSDILNIDPESGRRTFEFAKGPVFTNLLLADEINRATPRTQSALLEAMQERTVTVNGKNYNLPSPFMVFATQNPFESEGAFPLPEAQLDRFLVHSLVDYPESDAELKILKSHAESSLVGEQNNKIDQINESAKLSFDEVSQLIAISRSIKIDDELLGMVNDLVRSTRPESELCPEEVRTDIVYGAGPRAGISLISVARSLALIEGESVVRWRHVKTLSHAVLRHRIRLSTIAKSNDRNEDQIITNLLDRLEEKFKIASLGE